MWTTQVGTRHFWTRYETCVDYNYEIADSTVSCFADDTLILLGIKDEEDTQMLQNDLHKLYKWADE